MSPTCFGIPGVKPVNRPTWRSPLEYGLLQLSDKLSFFVYECEDFFYGFDYVIEAVCEV